MSVQDLRTLIQEAALKVLPSAPPLTFFQRILLLLLNRVRFGWICEVGWRGWLPVYAFVCKRHGVVVNYPQGHLQRLVCPLCLQEASL